MRISLGASVSFGRHVILALTLGAGLSSCASTKPFFPKSDYPPDPWVKGYTQSEDCLGGEDLAAKQFALPEYPRRAYKSGQQGWVILNLDVDASGTPQNIRIERALPDRYFGSEARKAAQKWQFAPPKNGALSNCRVLIKYQLGSVSLGG